MQAKPEGGKGKYTKKALRAKADCKGAGAHEQLAAAVKMVAEGQGFHAVVGLVEGCTLEQIKYAVKKVSAPTRPAWAILTAIEMGKLVKWCSLSARNDNPATECEVSDQVAKMLQCRRLANRANRRPSNVNLCRAEKRIALGLEGGTLSHRWFQGFYAANPSCQLVFDYERCAEACVCGVEPCPKAGMTRCATCQAAGRPSIKPSLCKVRECVAARRGPVPLALTHVGASPVPLALTFTAAEEAPEDAVGPEDEVMPIARVAAAERLKAPMLCCYACDDAVLTAEEVENGYCSGRRCKAKMHPACFLRHAGEAGAARGDLECFCQACWAKE